jgi:hypothetical protein
MQISEYSAIVEVARTPRGTPRWDEYKVRELLRAATIGGRKVLAAVHWYEPPKVVPCFGHDRRCEANGGCSDRQPHAIERTFSWTVILEGPPEHALLGRYWIGPGREAQIDLCSVSEAPEVTDRSELTRVEGAGGRA